MSIAPISPHTLVVPPAVPGRKLGRRPVRHDRRTLQFSHYVKRTTLPKPPPALSWAGSIAADEWPVFGNDLIGNCTICAAAHMIELWTADAGQMTVILPQNDIIAAYTAVSGYNPETGINDNGASELDVLNLWRRVGIGGSKITAFVSVNVADISSLKSAIQLFGGIYIGIDMPISVQGQDVSWTVPAGGPTGDGLPGSWGGHAVNCIGYDQDTIDFVSWGQVMKMTWEFWHVYVEESYCILSPQWIGASLLSPSGFNVAALQADLISLTG